MSGGAERYARAVERAWSASQQRAVVLSPREWELLAGWHERGIPLAIVLEAIEALEERRGGRRRPRTLTYLAPAVEEAWEVVREGRIPSNLAPYPEPAEDPVEILRSRREVSPEGPLAELLAEALRELDAGASRAEVDRRVDEAILSVADGSRVRELRRSIRARIDGFRGRMEPAALARVERRALVARLRREFGLPRLEV